MEHPRIWLFRDYFKKLNLKPPIIDVGGREKWKETKGYYILNIEIFTSKILFMLQI